MMLRLSLFSIINAKRAKDMLTMKKSLRLGLLTAALMGLILPSPALAYIGPGAGLGAIAVTVALLLGVLLLVIGLVWYPLKRLMKKKKASAVDNHPVNKPE